MRRLRDPQDTQFSLSFSVPEPDPLDTRKRRVSNDSLEAGDHLHRLQSLTTPSQSRRALSPSPLTNSMASSSPAKKGAKNVKKRVPPPPARRRNPTPQKTKKSVETIEEENEDTSSNSDGSASDSDDEDNAGEENLRIKLDGSFNNTTTYSIRSPMYQASRTTSEESNHGNETSEDEESDDDSDGSSESEDETEGGKKSHRRVGINPVTGRPLWTWLDGEDYKKRGTGKGKGKKVFHRAIHRESADSGEEVISVGDCAVFLSTAVDRPYIGKVEQFWESWNGSKMVKVKWFYHPEEIETSGKKVVDLKVQVLTSLNHFLLSRLNLV